ncbi:hypothetical protein [Streptomyces sp. NBC_00009]|uniref:hypothetical protein n=1 Tax=Streptomyces sp. NBC_00009 TaxID=2975620 RepID=UPI0032519112
MTRLPVVIVGGLHAQARRAADEGLLATGIRATGEAVLEGPPRAFGPLLEV